MMFSLISCGGTSSIGDVKKPMNCDNQSQKEFVYAVMHDSYLWADDVPVLTKEEIEAFENDEKLLEKLISPKDKSRKGQPFTHIMSKKIMTIFLKLEKLKDLGIFHL